MHAVDIDLYVNNITKYYEMQATSSYMVLYGQCLERRTTNYCELKSQTR
jgi:hypothetical protein